MIKKDISYKWATYKFGKGYFAQVDLQIEENNISENTIIENYSGKGYIGQGFIEEVPEIGYDTWKLAAKQGLVYAFSLTNRCWKVTVNSIKGLTTDTNPTIVGYTIICAFLESTGIHIDDQTKNELEKFALYSWEAMKVDHETIPDFFRLSYSK